MRLPHHERGLMPNVVGSDVAVSQYDGLGRRIVKTVSNSADLNSTYQIGINSDPANGSEHQCR